MLGRNHQPSKPAKRLSGLRILALIGTLILLALASLMYWMQGRYLLAPNQSNSLPGNLYLIKLGQPADLQPGEQVAFHHDAAAWGFPASAIWLKNVAGLPGDAIELKGLNVLIGGRPGGRLSPAAMQRASLTPVVAIAVPADHLYVLGEHTASFDSRYAEFGFVPMTRVIGRATRVW